MVKGDELRLGEWEFPSEPRGCSVQVNPQGSGVLLEHGVS